MLMTRTSRKCTANRNPVTTLLLYGLIIACMLSATALAQIELGRVSKLNSQNVVRLLDDDKWYLQDADIQSLSANEDPSSVARVKNAIGTRELSAIQLYIGTTTSPDDRLGALLRWTEHHNTGVAALAANQILRDGNWNHCEAISQRMRTWGIATQIQFVQKLLIFKTRNEILGFAGILGTNLLESNYPAVQSDWGVKLVSRLLAPSTGPVERDLIEKLAMRFPDEPFIWVAVSRGNPNDDLKHQARIIYDDSENCLALRGAAGLVVGKQDPLIYNQLVRWIITYLSEFASPDFLTTITSARKTPLSPSTQDMYKRLTANQPLLAVLRELPDNILRNQAKAFCKLYHGTAGLCTSTILAKRTPDILVSFWKNSSQSPPHELYKALFLSAMIEPPLVTDVTDLIPEESRSELQRQVDTATRSLVGPCINMTIWD